MYVILIVIVIFFFIGIDSAHNKIDELSYDIEMDMWDLKYSRLSYIDLSIVNFQTINSDFSVMPETVEAHLSGIKISGKILNTSSVDQSDIKFKVVIADESKEFEITQKINSGYARPFEIYIPNVPVGESDSAEMSYLESTIHFYNH